MLKVDRKNIPPSWRGLRSSPLRHAVSVASAAGIAALIGVSFSSTATAANDDNRRGCNLASLRGDYGILVSGHKPAGPGVLETFTGTAIRTYDGRGHFTQLDSLFGEVTGFAEDVPAYGTYEVKANCSGTSQIFFPGAPFPADTAFVIVAGGDEVKDAAAFGTTASLWRVRP